MRHICVLAFTVACLSPAITIAQRSDTTVRAVGAPLHPGVATLIKEIGIGVESGAPEYMFSSPAGIAIGNDGKMFVMDQGTGTSTMNMSGAIVRLYDVNGKFLRNVGRQGEGPGEYRSLLGIDRLPDGRVLVIDPRSDRINVYSDAGESLAQWTMQDKTRDFTLNRLLTDTAGFTYVRMSVTPPGAAPGARLNAWQRFDRNGKILDTLIPPPRPDLPRLVLTAGSRTMGVPFQAGFVTAMTRLGFFATARTDRYAIDLLKPAVSGGATTHWKPGAPVTSLRRPIIEAPFAPGEREVWQSTIERVMRREQPSWSWNGPPIPRGKPPVERILTAQDGRLWIKLAAPGLSAPPQNPADSNDVDDNIPFRAPDIYDILEPDGRYVGQVRFPDPSAPLAMRGDHVWVVTAGTDAVPRVIRYRIAW